MSCALSEPHGEQVSDLFAFAADNRDSSLYSGRSIDNASKIYLTTGDVLWPNDCRPMFTIPGDEARRHDFLKPGDASELRAEMDLIWGLTACTAEGANNGTFKRIDWEVIAAPATGDHARWR